MPPPSIVDILRHIAREEPLSSTVRTFRGLTRERLGQLLDEAATRLDPASKAEDRAVAGSPSSAAPAERPASSEPLGRVRVYSDGAARGNPGPAGAGAVVTDPDGQVLARLGRFLGTQTNNTAEYQGLLLGLRHAKSMGAREVDVYADSELLIRQLGGQYQVKSATLKPLFDEARKLLATFARVRLHHIPRAKNGEADEMSNRAIDERM
ncbi:ribonuclease HI family protein [Myxococcus landrumensis]|uniref:Reverse transcriptase-like protein n=1 Tax=Myxococcus landrumensis TaxID=2813577 RepID=A0ABX7N540_9BACT|nr:ribonuclease HI family protein [Myxococcus landrumus]QSQ13573.1 reverse transcriptase-like protein [Myxococcus landrumus]